jgi:hypothetical protein
MTPETRADSEPTDPRAGGLPATRIAEMPTPSTQREAVEDEPLAGLQIDEFLLVEELGRGSFGRVFLAEQEALNRRVALKVSRQRAMTADEGKSLGGLEHDHIVKVYSAFTHAATGWHCLCLQYVPGADLKTVIERLHAKGRPANGRDILDAIDAAGRRDVAFDPAALRDRDALAADDFPQAVCRLGARLAEALAFAHAKGVLHCDIKPGNILLSPYGRPMLADFNVSFDRERMGNRAGLGGTRAYMAPEYECALRDRAAGEVDARCDVYSLGVVLHELATGRRPDRREPESLNRLPREVALVIRRCLDPDPARRYQSAGELGAALAGAWNLLAAQRALPRPEGIGRRVVARPVLALVFAGGLPHVAASVVNIGFNARRLDFTEAQQQAFAMTVIAYNLIAYPLCLSAAITLIRRAAKGFAAVNDLTSLAADALRARALRLGRQCALIGALGWLPGGLIFPLVIDLAAGPVEHSARLYLHFLLSFTLSGLIGVLFSYLAVQFVVFRAFIPMSWNPDTYSPAAAREEVQRVVAPLGPLVLLASAIPLTGAMLLIAFEEGAMTIGFRILAAGLIGLGAFGVTLADRAVRRIGRLASVWGGEVVASSDTRSAEVYIRPLPSS